MPVRVWDCSPPTMMKDGSVRTRTSSEWRLIMKGHALGTTGVWLERHPPPTHLYL